VRYRHPIRLRLNGRDVEATVAADESLVQALRRCFQLYGARESCGQGVCGTCTVIVNRRAVSGCLHLAVMADGADVVTVEGLASEGRLHPVQDSFVSCSAFQCGFCTPGMILMSCQLLEENPRPSEDEIRHYLSGNICRCGAYPEIIQAVKTASEALTSRAEQGGAPR
jgi:aerobic-type carbon monoxide dehydrogenase small subunit (CoxS/CutS family)